MPRKERQIQTIAYLQDKNKILLAMKKRGFGEGRWNGYGGKVLPGEDIANAARREILEESKINAWGLSKSGVIDFSFNEKVNKILEVHIYRITHFKGHPEETEEMKPQWFNVDELPYSEMWPTDKIWLPLFLKKYSFHGKVHFQSPTANEAISYDIRAKTPKGIEIKLIQRE